jgi:dihydropteroate synthase
VLAEVTDALAESVERAENAGVESIVVDPGFGFGKTPQENLLLLRRTDALLDQLERPVMVGISRKSTIGAVLGENGEPAPVGERLYGSLGATAAAVTRGASLVRTHDVRATREMLHGLAAVVFS